MDTSSLLTILFGAAVLAGVPFTLGTLVLVLLHRSEVADPTRFLDPHRKTGNTVTALAGIVVGVLLWAVWISWGNFEYPTWAIVGCVITSVIAVIGLGFISRWRWTGPFVGALGGLFGFSTVCSIQMAQNDDTGLWGVGYMMIVIGGGVVLALLATGVMLVRMPKMPRTPSMGHP
ncbi:hypothetical protein ACTXK0_13085 [Corynebacterium variabile]|uniref:Putative membrane protein n=1 Tax=Corynebacterium variabile (strain DSM 44702 / CIP 107183 / JCM 12073 / NCIMB 30131) TaxID=858619 RepID=G0HB13_CORVD|nr:hypothetical protein [Corynebacterium variabile]AEK36138.1 putative membrane protein [Corynebacterium variabile DSM 44702]